MVHFSDIHPLTGFLRDHKSHLERLRATGRPELLTINGKAGVVVQEAGAYQRLVEVVEAIEVEQTIRTRVKSLMDGEQRVDADDLLSAVRDTLGINSSS